MPNGTLCAPPPTSSTTRPQSIAVCLVSLPERFSLLSEAIESVRKQNRQPDDLVIGVDYSRRGEVWNNNRLLDATDAEWVAFLHDDDIWLPDHLANAEQFFDSADVIVSRFELVGRQHIEPFHADWNDLRRTNWFPPSPVVVRRSVFGRWETPNNPPPRDWVDWFNWRRLLDAGARFADTQQTSVLYRFGHWSNGSWTP